MPESRLYMIRNRNRMSIARMVGFIGLLLFALMPVAAVSAQGAAQPIHIIPVDGEITPAMAAFLESEISEAEQAGAQGILIEIKTLGGRVDAAIRMRDAIVASKVPVAVFIETRAISAGALISIAAPRIVMASGSHIGAAQPIPTDPKTVAFVSGEFKTTAERTGRDPMVAAAMVDEAVEITGLVAKGQILDMSANEAKQYGFADFLADSRDDALKALGWESAPVVERNPDFRFRIAQFLTSVEVSTLLLVIGMLGLLVEFYTPGFGVPGIIGIVCFALYFTSGFLAGHTNLWALIVFVVGMILLIIEIIVPGFGIFGIAGLIAIFIGVVLAAPSVQQGIFSLVASALAVIIAIPILIKIFGKSHLVQRLVLKHSEKTELGYVHAPNKDALMGKSGVTLTVLRPAGSVSIEGQRVDAISEGEFLQSGTPVVVIRVEGTKVIVRQAD